MDKFQLPDFLQGVFDTATGVFDRIVDLELGTRELSVLTENLAFKKAQAFEATRGPTTFGTGGGQIVAGVSNTTLLIGGGLAVVGLILLTR